MKFELVQNERLLFKRHYRGMVVRLTNYRLVICQTPWILRGGLLELVFGDNKDISTQFLANEIQNFSSTRNFFQDYIEVVDIKGQKSKIPVKNKQDMQQYLTWYENVVKGIVS